MIIIFADQRDGVLKKASKEAISEGKRLGAKVSLPVGVILLGKGAGSVAELAASFGADKIFVSEMDSYSPDNFASTAAEVIKSNGGKYVLAPATAMCVDMVPRIAAICEAGFVSDITAVDLDGDNLLLTKPVYAGKAISTVKITSDVQMVTLRPNVFPMEENSGAGEVINVDSLGDSKAVAVSTEMKSGGKVELTEASIIVSAGRGLKDPENYPIIEDLCEVLGAALGASRAAVDAGWISHSHQVGQTGKVVSPKVYVACGISGAIQHLAGMGTSQFIIAINKDADAPIFNLASLGIVGDLFKVVPALTEELKKAQ